MVTSFCVVPTGAAGLQGEQRAGGGGAAALRGDLHRGEAVRVLRPAPARRASRARAENRANPYRGGGDNAHYN